jgi:CRISPR/Cas system-associated exonuclease Cas4 (RecB family)
VLVAEAPPEIVPRERTPEETVEPEMLTLPDVMEQHDSNVTVTGLAKFASCPRQYYLSMYLGYEGRRRGGAWGDTDDAGEEDRDLTAGEFGTQVHALLAGTPVERPDAEAVRLAEVFDQSVLGARAARATRAEREFDFLMAVEDLVVRGQVDLWFEEGGELVVVDYKTDDVRETGIQERAGDYSLQLRLYAMAVERITGRAPDRAYLHFLRPNKIVEVDLGPSLLESPERVARDLVEAQAGLRFPLNEGERCRRCPFYKDLCPAVL